MNITLGNLLEEIKFGKEFVDSKNTIKTINTFMDEDYNIFLAGQRSSALLEECDMNKSFNKKLGRAVRNYTEFENKLIEGKEVSSVYAKMKINTIVEDVNAAIIELDKNPKVLRESNKDAISKIIASLSFGVELLGENTITGRRDFREAKQTLQAFVDKEARLIKESM
ncbi:MAG: hypothetical protein DRJ01_00345 [Bacteroidetes bacterium]|nr:MAG: hypothetical protein DRJ01_00345 [Bacteroidota bacterium]